MVSKSQEEQPSHQQLGSMRQSQVYTFMFTDAHSISGRKYSFVMHMQNVVRRQAWQIAYLINRRADNPTFLSICKCSGQKLFRQLFQRDFTSSLSASEMGFALRIRHCLKSPGHLSGGCPSQRMKLNEIPAVETAAQPTIYWDTSEVALSNLQVLCSST